MAGEPPLELDGHYIEMILSQMKRAFEKGKDNGLVLSSAYSAPMSVK